MSPQGQLQMSLDMALKAALDGLTDKRGLTILTKPKGQPLTYRRLAEIMRSQRARLGPAEL